MADNVYDAIVIGSGISGGWAAKELCEKGLKTIMLERGRDIPHIKGYVNANKEAWDYPHRGTRTQQMIKDYPVLKRDYPLNESNLDYWCSDKDSPYTEIKRFDWFRGARDSWPRCPKVCRPQCQSASRASRDPGIPATRLRRKGRYATC